MLLTFCYHVHFEEFHKIKWRTHFLTDDKKRKTFLIFFFYSYLLLASRFMFSFKQFCFPVQFLVPEICTDLFGEGTETISFEETSKNECLLVFLFRSGNAVWCNVTFFEN